ncbi:MAG: methyltransferase domain-containing protein [Vulcanimicrobiota bacterium]
MRDRLFESQEASYESFEFNAPVAQVFDDMVRRSVPHYEAVQELMARLVLARGADGPIYDLGCSTGNTLVRLVELAEEPLKLVGVDQSQAMLDHAAQKLAPRRERHDIELVRADIEPPEFAQGPPTAVILSLVAQFLRPVRRQALLDQIRARLKPGGCLVMLEKVILPGRQTNNLYIEQHHHFKLEQGYSVDEIRRKREALENRLVPFEPEENLQMLGRAGFSEVSIFFSWLNFQGYLALKDEQEDAG